MMCAIAFDIAAFAVSNSSIATYSIIPTGPDHILLNLISVISGIFISM